MVDMTRAVQAKELNDEVLLEICKAAQVLACECPGYIARILRQVRTFRDYTNGCSVQFLQDTATHTWLASKATEIENVLFQTMIELMQRENLIDESYNISSDKISDQAREIVLQQIGRSW